MRCPQPRRIWRHDSMCIAYDALTASAEPAIHTGLMVRTAWSERNSAQLRPIERATRATTATVTSPCTAQSQPRACEPGDGVMTSLRVTWVKRPDELRRRKLPRPERAGKPQGFARTRRRAIVPAHAHPARRHRVPALPQRHHLALAGGDAQAPEGGGA